MLELNFLSNEGDINQGLGDAGIETFRDAPYASVARECGQNSSDARAKSPVKLSFDVISIPASELPSLNSFKSAIESCLKKSVLLNIDKEIDFFECAKKSISKSEIKILRIADSNTKGLVGPCEQGTPFHSLLKSTGVSVKNDVTSGGSFGIGKNAAFAVSEIQTVFYSTKYEDDGSIKSLYQGKSIFVSHSDDKGKKNLATGYWGEKGYLPTKNSENIPAWMERENIGTSLFCICFRDEENWEFRLAASLMQNFFSAINRNEMNFSINNGVININRDTLATLFNNPDVRKAANNSGNCEDYEFSRYLYECLKAVETKEEIFEINNLGKVSIKILVKEGLPKRVCFIRNGMYIADNLELFGEKFLRFPLYKDFVALVEPLDDLGITLFKNLENPKHNGFSAARLSKEQDRDNATHAMKELGKSIREAIKQRSFEMPKDTVSIDELSEFFTGEVDPDKISNPNAEDDNPEKLKYKPKKRTKVTRPGMGEENGGNGGKGTKTGKGGSNGGGKGVGGGAGGSGKGGGGKLIKLIDNRNILDKVSSKKRLLILTSDMKGSAVITVFAEGLNTTEKLNIIGTNFGKVSSGTLRLAMDIGVKNKIIIEFDEEYNGPIEVTAISADGEGGVINEAK